MYVTYIVVIGFVPEIKDLVYPGRINHKMLELQLHIIQ